MSSKPDLFLQVQSLAITAPPREPPLAPEKVKPGANRAAEATSLLLLTILTALCLLVAAWVVLALLKSRWFSLSSVKRPEPRKKIKSPWREAGRRLAEREARAADDEHHQ